MVNMCLETLQPFSIYCSLSCGLAIAIDKNLREKNNVEYAKYRWSEWAMSQRIPKGVFITMM